MKAITQIVHICQYQLHILCRNYKIYAVLICMSVFMLNALEPLRDFLVYTKEGASPYLFPFLFSDVFLNALIFSGVLLFFVDAPFYNKEQLFVITRSGISKWLLGQMVYIVCISFLYMLFIFFLSIFVLMPQIDVSGEWGRIWTTLSVTDAGFQFGITVGVSEVILFHYTPWEAVILVYILGSMICIFYGFLVWCLNIYWGRLISIVVSLASILLVTRVRFLPGWLMYLVPTGWMDISNLSEYTTHGITIQKSVLMLIITIIALAVIVYRRMSRIDIAK